MKRKLAVFLALCMIFTQAIPAWAETIKEGNIGAAALETTASPSDAEKATSSDAEKASPSDALSDTRVENVMYLDENGDEQTAECIMIRGNWDELSFTQGGWYAVDGDVTIAGRIWNRAPAGEAVHVILMDGCQWTVPKGINNGGGSILNFYGQKESDGRLCIEHCDSYCAGIGTRSVKDGVGTVTINGGDFLIRGGSNAAGIGGGNDCDCGTVTINGGHLEIYSGSYAAAIGASQYGGNIRITINGGYVRAVEQYYSCAAIGGSYFHKGDFVIINGGTVIAEGMFGIGGHQMKGNIEHGGDIVINGGTVKAKTGATAIVGKFDANITITGGKVTAISDKLGAGIGDGESYSDSTAVPNITITGGEVTAIGGPGCAGIGGVRNYRGSNVTISGGVVTAIGGSGAPGIGGGTQGLDDGTLTLEYDAKADPRSELEILAGPEEKSRSVMRNAEMYMATHYNYAYIHPIPGYTVMHYGEGSKDGRVVLKEEWLKANTGDMTSAVFYTTFENYSVKSMDDPKTVAEDGSTVVNIYYKWTGKTNTDSDGDNSSGSSSGNGAGSALYSSGWYMDGAGNWMYKSPSGKAAVNTWLCDDVVAVNGQNVWYLIGADGKMITAGLIQDADGHFYSLETNHNGLFGMMRYQDGWYDCSGTQVYLTFNRNHDGSFGAVTNADGIEKLKAIYGVTASPAGSENCLYTRIF